MLQCIESEGADTVFENLLITGGLAEGDWDSPDKLGGGMRNNNNSPTLTDCTFIECCQVVPPNSFFDNGGNDYDSWCDECRANVDCVGEVDAADLGLLLSAWNTTEAQYDINNDGVVGGGDLGLLLNSWGPCP